VSEFIAERMWPEAPIERSIFGTDDPERIWEQVLEVCPEAVDCFAFEASVGALFGLKLRDGSRVALKIHLERDTGALEAVQRVQAHLVEQRFPCPQPLGVRGAATLEQWADKGVYRDAHDPAVRRVLARYLARLFSLTRRLQPLEGLGPFFPSPDGPLWPVPHNVLFDFEATASGAAWIDEIAREAKPLRDAGAGEFVIGHGDWTVKHFRFAGLRPTIVYDWDSLNTDYETVFVGNSAASFTYTDLPVEVWPTRREAQAFLADYEQERGRPFTAEELRAAGAAAVYSRAYSTRCAHAGGGDAEAMRLEEYADVFLSGS
jgi:hypothetical protein